MDSKTAIDVLGALAQPTRLSAFRLLVEHAPDGLPAGEVARRLAVPQNTLSAHLAVLAAAKLVAATRDGRSIVYRAELGTLRALTLYLLKDCCRGRAEVCAPVVADLLPCCPTSER
ncbi:metalloregulator ArsR/SmtB family transcription factor [Coralloluteibacterium thermophilus]|uniref:Metalloregulator ArsR/SmtB family transcription factor n=1 Tax=Coralloluteibacterium thermophilum TaxID=2707049 RepID=A0ABV9NT72_9GAMM